MGPFAQGTLVEFEPQADRDYLIIFRSPNGLANDAVGQKVWWSCDQHTTGDFKSFAKTVEEFVTISPRHADYFRTMYGIIETITIDLPVRDDYDKPVEKVSKRCAYTSIPDRGVMQLNAAWPLINRDVPDSSLVITSDWRLWDRDIDQSVITPYRLPFARQPNVTLLRLGITAFIFVMVFRSIELGEVMAVLNEFHTAMGPIITAPKARCRTSPATAS